jgi:hypothetical protein
MSSADAPTVGAVTNSILHAQLSTYARAVRPNFAGLPFERRLEVFNQANACDLLALNCVSSRVRFFIEQACDFALWDRIADLLRFDANEEIGSLHDLEVLLSALPGLVRPALTDPSVTQSLRIIRLDEKFPPCSIPGVPLPFLCPDVFADPDYIPPTDFALFSYNATRGDFESNDNYPHGWPGLFSNWRQLRRGGQFWGGQSDDAFGYFGWLATTWASGDYNHPRLDLIALEIARPDADRQPNAVLRHLASRIWDMMRTLTARERLAVPRPEHPPSSVEGLDLLNLICDRCENWMVAYWLQAKERGKSGTNESMTSQAGSTPKVWIPRCNGQLLCSPDCAVVKHGKNEYTFTPSQRLVVKAMIEGFESKPPRKKFTAKELAELGSGSASTSKSDADYLRSLFRPSGSPNPAWGNLIVSTGTPKDMYTLKLEPQPTESVNADFGPSQTSKKLAKKPRPTSE